MRDDLDAALALGHLERACPVRTAIGVISGKWKPAILRAINETPRRYGEIRADVPGIADQALTRHLRELRADGVIERDETASSYRLTLQGHRLAGIMDALERWGEGYLDMRNEKDGHDRR